MPCMCESTTFYSGIDGVSFSDGEGTRLSLWISFGVKGEESPGFHVFCSCLLVSYTVEPPNKGHSGTSHFVHYREVVLFLEI